MEQFSAVPYLATLLNCMFWVVYGLPMVHPHSTLVLTINGSGMVIELAYVLLFIIHSHGSNRLRVLVILASEVASVALVGILVIAFTHTLALRSMIIGVLCVLFGTMMYAAPLSVMVSLFVSLFFFAVTEVITSGKLMGLNLRCLASQFVMSCV